MRALDVTPTVDGFQTMGAALSCSIVSEARQRRQEAVARQLASLLEVAIYLAQQPDGARRLALLVRAFAFEPAKCAHCGSTDGPVYVRPDLVGDDPTCDRCEASIRKEAQP